MSALKTHDVRQLIPAATLFDAEVLVRDNIDGAPLHRDWEIRSEQGRYWVYINFNSRESINQLSHP